MPVPQFANPFNEPRQGIVDANGDLEIKFTAPNNQTYTVSQISIEMETAPQGCTCEIRYMSSLVTPAPSARRASAGGEPPIFLQGGEHITVKWSDATPNDIGRALFVYTKGTY